MSIQPQHQALIGTKVDYKSTSGKTYEATITAIPGNPGHAWTHLPTASLEFRDERGKLVRKARVMPHDYRFSDRHDSGRWKPQSADAGKTLEELVHGLLDILDCVEESDAGREFRPTVIQTCRTQHAMMLASIMAELKKRVRKT